MYCRRVTRSLVSCELSDVMSLIQLLRLIRLVMLVQPVRARMAVKTSTRPNPRASFILTLMFANQLFIEFSERGHFKGEAVGGSCDCATAKAFHTDTIGQRSPS
ncbi:hypothetical protein ALQ49_04973 [Pseudomonas syringae pv. apii]|nr:hypothetical protein ALQ49_04973 [Pseudomonas syringae pv. apii]